MNQQLYVFFNKDLVGILKRNHDNTLSFKYQESWRQNKKNFPLSPVMPLEHTSEFDNRQTSAFFENLLPEGKVLNQLEKLMGRSLKSGYQFLELFGIDCAGAFVISPGPDISKYIIEDDFEQLNIQELVRVHKDNKNLMTHIMDKHKGRFSLAGTQDKVPVVYLEGKVFIPTKGAPTTHILKPPHLNKQIKDSVYNEYFCMKLASACGLEVPNVEIIKGEYPFYIVERYDRGINIHNDKERIECFHQFDFCQAQNFLSNEKYEEDGGPGLKDNYHCLNKYSSKIIHDSKRFINWICFNLLIGNNDCHSKNISFLMKDGMIRLAPFYDLLCTSIYSEYSSNFSFKIGDNAYWGQWNNSHFEKEVISWGLDKTPDLLLKTFGELESILQETLKLEVMNFKEKFPKIKTAGRIKAEIEKRIESFNKRILNLR